MTEKNYIQLDEQGFSPCEGWLKVYHYHGQTGEFTQATEEFRPAGVGLPANATDIKPPPSKKGFAICFNGEKWCYLADHRGTVVYDKHNGQAKTIDKLGEIAKQYTILVPVSQFDKWNGERWQIDLSAKQQALITQAEQMKKQLDELAKHKIERLQDAIELDIALTGDDVKLKAWRKYRVLLDRIDTSTGIDINWPNQPE